MTSMAVLPDSPSQAPDVPEVLARLTAVRSDRPVVVSVYLRLEVQDRIRSRYRIALRDAIRLATHAVDQSPISHAEREALHRDLGRVRDLAADSAGVPHTPGLGVFACEALGLFEVVPLPRVLQTRVLLGERPRLAEALAATETLGRIAVAVVDRTHARIFAVTATGVVELPGVVASATRGGRYHSDRADSPGWGERDFHNRIREERHRHAAAVAAALGRLVAQQACQGIVLAGDTRNVGELLHFLPGRLASLVLGTRSLNPTSATLAEVRQAAAAVRAGWERAREASVIGDLEQALGTGWAVNGARPTLRALAHGQVRTLFVRVGQAGSGYRCSGSGRLALAKADCRGEGTAEPVPDIVSEVLDEAMRQHLEIELISDPDLGQRLDGLAAMLRFR